MMTHAYNLSTLEARHEEHEFKPIHGYRAKPCLKMKKRGVGEELCKKAWEVGRCFWGSVLSTI